MSGGARLRILMSAYACGPGDESEAGAGWAFACAAARDHDVWLLTRHRFAEGIDAALAADPALNAHLHVTYVDLSERVLRLKRRGFDVHWYYALWQRRVSVVAASLHESIGFDVAHHVTFAVDWQLCGLRRLTEVPLVWGPVGGATYLPWRLARWLGWRGILGELGRSTVTRLARRIFGDPVARRAAVVIAQNPQVGHRFRAARRVVVEPNAALTTPVHDPGPGTATVGPSVAGGTGQTAIFVGRLIPWKGARLAVAALARPELAGWRLDIYGSGRDGTHLMAMAARLKVADRIRFLGQRPRAEVLAAYSQADAMIFPSLHDSAGWAVGEASAAGCPVVCLDVGGPPLLAGPNGHVVAPSGAVVANLARALVEAGRERGVRYPRWSADRMPALVNDWYADAASTAPAAGRAPTRPPTPPGVDR